MEESESQEERIFAESVEDFLGHEYTFAKRCERLGQPEGPLDRALWRKFAELGWLALPIPERHGGLGQPVGSAMSLMESVGRHLVLEPYLSGVLAPVSLLTSLAIDDECAAALEAIGSGSALWAFAHEEPGMRSRWREVRTEARTTDGGVLLNGTKTRVSWGADADVLLVSAKEQDGISLFMVDAGTPGVTWQRYDGTDDVPLGDLQMREVHVPASKRVGRPGDAGAAIDDAMFLALAATCHQAVGALDRLFALTLEYAKMRRQFGQPIAGFQVIQHKLVDMYTSIELSRTMARTAVAHLAPDAPRRELVLSAAKAQVSASCRFVGEQAIQIHGGIGTTAECSASHYFRTLFALEKRLGDRHHHLGAIADAISARELTLHD